MPVLAAVLAGVLRFLVVRLIAALGVGIVTFTGFLYLLDQLKNEVLAAWHSLPVDVVSLLQMGGFVTGLSILFGAYAFRAAMLAMGKLTFGLLGG